MIQHHSFPPTKQRQPFIEVITRTPTQDSSDDTIIYTPPPSPKKQSKKKQVAKFVIRTVGLKTHCDTDAIEPATRREIITLNATYVVTVFLPPNRLTTTSESIMKD